MVKRARVQADTHHLLVLENMSWTIFAWLKVIGLLFEGFSKVFVGEAHTGNWGNNAPGWTKCFLAEPENRAVCLFTFLIIKAANHNSNCGADNVILPASEKSRGIWFSHVNISLISSFYVVQQV